MISKIVYRLSFSIFYPSLLLLLLLSWFPLSSEQPDFRFHNCDDNNGKYTNTSAYSSNLNKLLTYVTSQTGETRFYNFTAGENSGVDQVNGIALCQGDRTPSECKSCLSDAARKIRSVCPNQKQAMGWYSECMLRYSNGSIFSKMETWPILADYNVNNASDPDVFNRQLGTLLQQLSKAAAAGDNGRKYASSSPVAVSDFASVYGLVECTPDLVDVDCGNCIDSIISYIPQCCESKKAAMYITPSCHVGYDLYQFYRSDPVSPPSPSPIPATSNATTTGTSGKGSNKRGKLVIAITVSTVAGYYLSRSSSFVASSRERWQKVETSTPIYTNKNAGTSIESLRFDFSTIREATNQFSDANKLGRGGFGVVYKGTLSDGQQIAVKRLAKNSTQGESEFKNEVLLVAKLQHRNLVRLLGFCLDKDERLLIYELLPNSSLDHFLFDPIKCSQLNWQMRHNIITGIARGLLYLHEDSHLRIIHRDLKASNVLLDTKMNAKISDFGIAKLFRADQTHGDTNRIVGTFGYMAPEYALHGFFSAKSDVYSFGVLVLEIISGRKSIDFQQGENSEDLITWVWRNWRDGTALRIIDGSMSGESSRRDILRCIHIGLLCVEEDPNDRPTMSSIILMFSSQTFTLPTPSHPAYVTRTFIPLRELMPKHSKSNLMQKSVNEDSSSEFFPR